MKNPRVNYAKLLLRWSKIGQNEAKCGEYNMKIDKYCIIFLNNSE